MAKNKTFYRSVEVNKDAVDVENRTVRLSFSSEEPYERYNSKYGAYFEVLDHSEGGVDLTFLASGRAPLLRDHQTTVQVGVVREVQVSDGRGYAVVQLSRSEDGTRELQDIEDGIRTNISVGYWVSNEEVVGERDGKKIVRAKWRPVEISTVSIPADETVGVGRKVEQVEDDTETENEVITTPTKEETKMTVENKTDNVNIELIREETRKAEQARVRELTQLGQKFGLSADEFIRNDKTVEEFRAAILDKMDTKTAATAVKSEPSIDLSKKEERSYSFMKAIRAQLGDARYVKEAGLEIEVSRTLADQMGVEAKGIIVPHSMLVRAPLGATATYGSSNGANLVETTLGSFVDLLRNKMVMAEAGATILSGLRGNLALPKANVGSTAYWVNEVTGVSASDPKMTQVTFTPKTVGTYVDATRQLVLQSSYDVEAYLRDELIKTLAIELDRVGLYGNTALGQPKGIIFQSGLNTVDIPTSAPTFGNVWSMIASVEADNALEGNLAFVTSPVIRAAMATTQKGSGVGFIYENGQVAGYRVISSNQVAATDIFFGDFSSAVYGLWSGIDVSVDLAALSTSGGIRVIALQSADFNVKHGESFCLGQ